MKKFILLALVAVLYSTVVVGQNQPIPNQYGVGETSIGKVVVKSKVKLEYESRTQTSDTIYVSIQNWSYNSTKDLYTAQITDYIKEAGKYKKINSKAKTFTKEEINTAFTTKANSILPAENYANELVSFLSDILLKETKTVLPGTTETIYGGTPANWEIFTQ